MKRFAPIFFSLSILLVGISYRTSAQNVGINTSGTTPNASAILDINASPNFNQGLLIPRMTDAQRQTLKSPTTGLLIYNTTSNSLNFYNGSGWQQLGGNSVSSTSGSGAGPGNGIAINTTGAAPNASALLDISSTIKGMLIPRTTQGSVTATTGITIYNTATNTINVYNGSSWFAPCSFLLDNTTGSGATVSGVAINSTGAAPSASAILDISSSSLGMLFPSLTSTKRDAVKSPAQGLLIYCTTDATLEYWTGTAWMGLQTGVAPSAVSAAATPNPICIGSALTITGTATGATGWGWAGPNSFSAGTQNGTLGTFTFASQGTYTLTASNGCGSAAPVTTASISARIMYVPITLTNSQSAATIANFQQMITVNSSLYTNAENTGLQNVEFSTGAGATGTILNAWLESGATNTSTSTVYWVNLGTNTIAASGGTLTIYMDFMPTNVLAAS